MANAANMVRALARLPSPSFALRLTRTGALPWLRRFSRSQFMSAQNVASSINAGGVQSSMSTLDESVADTLKRDVRRVAYNVRAVLLPGLSGSAGVQALRDWDLWGPLLFTLTLAVLLSVQSSSPETTFAIIFAIVWLGAVVLTLNVLLLGGRIIFFQSVAVIGYCLFPLDVASILCLAWSNKIYQLVLLSVGALWSLRCCIPFIAATVSERRRALAVYPVLLMYTTLAWLALLKG